MVPQERRSGLPVHKNFIEGGDTPRMPFSVAKQQLIEPGAVDFKVIAASIPPGLDEDTLEEVRASASVKIFDTFMAGHFRDLQGAQQLLDQLETQITLPEETMATINGLLPRLDEGAIIGLGLSQPSVVGEYNVEGARRILKHSGFTEEETGDEAVKEVLNLRHVLGALKQHSVEELPFQNQFLPRLFATGELEA